MNDKTGQVNSTKLVQDISHIFPKSTEGAAIHFGNLDLNSPKFMSSHMSTRWIPDTEFAWNLLVEGLDEQGHKSMVNKHNVNNMSLRVSAQPVSPENLFLNEHLIDLRKLQW